MGCVGLALAQSGCWHSGDQQCDTVTSCFLGGQNGIEMSGYFDCDGTLLNVSTAINQKNINIPFYISGLRGFEYDSFKKIQVSVTNRNQNNINLQYKITWFDSCGMELDSNLSHWEPVEIYGRMTKTISLTAHSPMADSFTINIRPINYSKVLK